MSSSEERGVRIFQSTAELVGRSEETVDVARAISELAATDAFLAALSDKVRSMVPSVPRVHGWFIGTDPNERRIAVLASGGRLILVGGAGTAYVTLPSRVGRSEAGDVVDIGPHVLRNPQPLERVDDLFRRLQLDRPHEVQFQPGEVTPPLWRSGHTSASEFGVQTDYGALAVVVLWAVAAIAVGIGLLSGLGFILYRECTGGVCAHPHATEGVTLLLTSIPLGVACAGLAEILRIVRAGNQA